MSPQRAVIPFLLFLLPLAASFTVCPGNYNLAGEFCVKASETQHNSWNQAKAYCETIQGRLVDVDSEAKASALKGFLKTNGTCSHPTAVKQANCIEFTFKGVKYAAGECSFVDAFNDCPWCAIGPPDSNNEYSGGAGDKNWDFCNSQCCPLFHNFWIGLSSQDGVSGFVWSGSNTSPSFLDWAPGYPVVDSFPSCAYLDSSISGALKWKNNNCDSHGIVALCEPIATSLPVGQQQQQQQFTPVSTTASSTAWTDSTTQQADTTPGFILRL